MQVLVVSLLSSCSLTLYQWRRRQGRRNFRLWYDCTNKICLPRHQLIFILLYIYVYIYIFNPRGDRTNITLALMKKAHHEESPLFSNMVKTWHLARTNSCCTLIGVFSNWKMEIYQLQNCVKSFTFHHKIHKEYKMYPALLSWNLLGTMWRKYLRH